MVYNLTKLGWKAFQDLAAAVAAEVLKLPVQTFLGSHDGGRDGAFLGTWEKDDGTSLKSTVRCKFLGKPGANLSLPQLKEELPKAAQLVRDGLTEGYVILTNTGVSGAEGRGNLELWVPCWIRLRPSAYTTRGGVGTIAAHARVVEARYVRRAGPRRCDRAQSRKRPDILRAGGPARFLLPKIGRAPSPFRRRGAEGL